jgi:5-methylcytosine-specific restriction protein A
MTRYRTCSWKACTNLATEGSRCQTHARDRYADDRPNATDRGYGSPEWRATRKAVIERDPWCVNCHERRSDVADHWPDERIDLVLAGVTDPDSPDRLRGLCRRCHASRSAKRRTA